ncbi:hypothetical protein M9979_06230 [Sphingomonas sp. RP10(2022)]|uniref:Tetratricopeptide repeat protein n=1 Tax=Sphingomonas liriopis TaxID=2949094 RepID=A0A9X2KT34_9SPHN|nr:hypothetical protein [Sphingomonas liriopis]MCP3734473.1 hypothetical protein [Sphingomonas liriopis]
MGWLTLALLAVATGGALVLLRVDRLLWSMVGAALMLGAAGYAWQGSPGMRASPARPDAGLGIDDPALFDLRERMLGRFTADAAYLTAADAMNRAGDRRSAVRAILGGLNRYPRSVMLWTGLGTALATHDGNVVSPPALFAFRQAIRVAPAHPAPSFFLGLAYVRAGDFPAARQAWARALALSPQGASYRRDIAMRLALLDRLLAEQGG